MTVADRIREKRLELELSQADLARLAKYSDKTAISKIENAGNNITMKQVRRIAEALGVSAAFLMGWADISEEVETINGKTLGDLQNNVEVNPEVMSLYKKFGSLEVSKALRFAEVFLKATPERRQIALEILQTHQDDA